jgi:hypothetical protein
MYQSQPFSSSCLGSENYTPKCDALLCLNLELKTQSFPTHSPSSLVPVLFFPKAQQESLSEVLYPKAGPSWMNINFRKTRGELSQVVVCSSSLFISSRNHSIFLKLLTTWLLSPLRRGFCSVLILIYLVVLGFEIRALHLLGRCSTISTMPPDLFRIRSCFLP